MRILMILVVFFLLGAFFIISNDNLHLKDKEQAMQFAEKYYNWIFDLGSNVKGMAGYIVKSEWLPSDENNSNEEIVEIS